jgi:ribosomal-protein-alanine N-acetyltransferase
MSRSRSADLPIRTARLLLRPARATDLSDLFGVYSDPRAMRYWSDPPHTDRTVTRRLLAAMLEQPDPPTYLAVERGGRVIGTAGLHAGNEIGFILDPNEWGQGLAGEMLAHLLPYLFAVGGHDRITADIDPRNARSRVVLHRAGFVATGRAERTFCVAGVWSDSLYMALDRPDG